MRPANAALDGDVVFGAATGDNPRPVDLRDLTELGTLGGDCLARAVARGVYEAEALPFAGAVPSWRQRFGR